MKATRQNYTQANIHYWSNRASGYSAVNQEELQTDQHRVWQETLQSAIRSHFGKDARELRILDIGTGPGFFAIVLTELGHRVTAVDCTAAMLEQARGNAGALAEKIDFRLMNAEELSFPEGSFDVIVSRNLTWNLHHPEKAYGSWNRVLKPGGLLLNFDANWYRYLHDDKAMDGHKADRNNVALTQVADDTAGTDVEAMESIAYLAPLSAQNRPEWDIRLLKGLGMSARADREVWRRVWTEAERINNASTPMFLIQAVKS